MSSTSVTKFVITAGEIQSDSSFKAMLGQKGLSFRDVNETLKSQLSKYPNGTKLTLRISQTKDSSNLEIIGPTMSYMILSTLGDNKSAYQINDAEKVYLKYEEVFNRSYRTKEKALSCIKGSLVSYGIKQVSIDNHEQ